MQGWPEGPMTKKTKAQAQPDVAVVFSPFRTQPAVELGNSKWRKQLLPIGDFDYKGRTLSFTKDYLLDLAKSFKDKAFGQVPFQLADADNKHTNDPERTRGFVDSVEVGDDGLYLTVDLTEDGEKVLKANPNLGVSARIYENYERSDGRRWTAALQHVLGTLDPHIPGMKSWEQVAALSNAADAAVLDLTDMHFDEEGGGEQPVALTAKEKKTLKGLLGKLGDGNAELTDEDLEALLEDEGGADGTETEGGDGNDDELTDEELNELIAEAEAEEAGSTAPIAASNSGDAQVIDLASNPAFVESQIELARVTAKLNEQTFRNEKDKFVHAGLPPKVVELARPLLEGEAHIVELAGGDQIDAGSVMRRVLIELTRQIKILDLSDIMGRGDVPDEDREAQEAEEAERANFIVAERKRMGL